MKKAFDYITIISFLLVVSLIGIHLTAGPDPGFLTGERRYPAEKPSLSLTSADSVSKQLNGYFLDKMPFRSQLRNLKVAFASTLLFQSTVDGYRLKNGSEYQILDNWNGEYAKRNVSFLSKAAKNYYPNSRVYYSFIPDKGYYAGEINHPDLELLKDAFGESFAEATFADVSGLIGFDSFYKTDIHLRQECETAIAEYICRAMNADYFDTDEFTGESIGEFRGGLSGQAAFITKSDVKTVMHSDMTDSATATDYLSGETVSIYDGVLFETSIDPYDVFLGGEKAVITIDNKEAEGERILVIFRDSYARSIAPLLLKSYSRIVLVDFRYIPISYLETLSETVAPDGSDILVLLSAQTLGYSLYKPGE